MKISRWPSLLLGVALVLSAGSGVASKDDSDNDLLEMLVAIMKNGGSYSSEFYSQSLPTGMRYGSWYQVNVSFRNIGVRPWVPGEVRLINAGSSNFGVSEVALSSQINEGELATFSFSVKSECGSRLGFPFFSCSDSQPRFKWIMAGPAGAFGPSSPVVSNLFGLDDVNTPVDGALPARPTTPMIDLFIPGVPPPTILPPTYRAPNIWSDIKW